MAAIISLATITFANLSGRSPTDTGSLPNSRQWLGLSIVFLMLSAASDLGIESAGGMAILVMVTVLLARGEDAAGYLGVRLAGSGPPLTQKQLNQLRQANKGTPQSQGKVPQLQRTKPSKPTKANVV
jgi:hypothetical protein